MNSLRLIQSGDGQVFLVPLHLIHDAKRVIRPKQRNPSGLQVVREMPAGMMIYGKDDTLDAFGQIRLSAAMQPLFGFSFKDTETNQSRFFKCARLPQYFELSSQAYRTVSEFLMAELYQHPETAELIRSCKLYFGNNVDDFLTAAVDVSVWSIGRTALHQTLNKYSLPLKPEKSVGPVSELSFSGLQLLPDSRARPLANRKPLTAAFATALWETFEKNIKHRAKILTLLRSAAGSFEYNRSFGTMLGQHAEMLQKFYNVITAMQADSTYTLSEADKADVKEALFHLTDSCTNGCPALYLSEPPFKNVVASLLITDANEPSYGGGCFWVVAVDEPYPEEDLAKLPEFQLLISELGTKLGAEMPAYIRILPVQFTGGVWRNKTDCLRSSTYRERVAHIYVHDKVYPYMAGHDFLICREIIRVAPTEDFRSFLF